MEEEVEIIIPNREYLFDEKIPISVHGLQPFQHVTLRSYTQKNKRHYVGHAHYVASIAGEVDTSKDASFGGHFIGVNQMGLFGTMLPALGQIKGLRYIPGGQYPEKYFIQVFDGHLDENTCNKPSVDHKMLAESVVYRTCCGKGVIRTEVHHGRLRGTIFQPPGPGPFKGVIDIYGGTGGIVESKAAMLASRNFICYTLPFMRYQDLPPGPSGIEIEYFLEAIEYFSNLSQVMQGGIALVGLSFGGALVLKLSTLTEKVCAVIAMSSNYYLVMPMLHQGKVLPTYFKSPDDFVQVRFDNRGGCLEKDFYDTSDKMLPYGFPIEKSSAKFLLVVGQNDLVVEAEHCMKRYVERMRRFGKENQVSLLAYPKTGHFLDPPYGPQTFLYYNPHYKAVNAAGGELIEQAAACEHCWHRTLEFLAENIPGKHTISSSKL